MTTVGEILAQAVQHLDVAALPDARLEAEFLVAALLKRSRARMILDRHEPLQESVLKKIQCGIKQRARRWPLAYITQDQPFRELTLTVSPAVLIPRPETEEFVEHILERLRREKRLWTVADIGTGSGCISISLARAPHVGHVWAIDRSQEALRIARHNARRYTTAEQWTGLPGHLIAPLRKRKLRVDLLVANLPYVSTKDMRELEPELFREPRAALDGGADGLTLIYELIGQAPAVLNAKGWLMLEIGIHQDMAVRKLLQVSGLWQHIEVHRDLSGIARFVDAQLKG